MALGWGVVAGTIARIVDTLWPSKKEALFDKLKSLEAKFAEAMRKGDTKNAAIYKKQMEDLRDRANFTNE